VTGNLGGKIIKALLTKDVEVRAIVRLETDKKIKDLEQKVSKSFRWTQAINLKFQNIV
jgi:uncharacterized protein YbjT (DUF2867 family)